MRLSAFMLLCLTVLVSAVGCRSAQRLPPPLPPAAHVETYSEPVAEEESNETVASATSGAPLPPPRLGDLSVTAGDLDVVAADVNETRLDVEDLAGKYARTERKLSILASQVEELDGKVAAVEGRVGTLENASASAPVANAPRSSVTKQSTLQRLVHWWRAGSPMADSCLRQIRRDNVGATKADILVLLRTGCDDQEFLTWAGRRIPADQGQEGSANP